MPSRETVSLYYVGGGSDKVYHVQLEETMPGKWSCNAQYGRRGSTLNNTNKANNTSWSTAKKEYDDIVSQKVGKGYSHGPLAGRSAAAGPAVAPAPPKPTVKLPPMPTWPDLELSYAEVATFFGEPATFTTSPQAWMVLMVDIAAGAQEGLPEAVAQVKALRDKDEILDLLSADAKAWYSQLGSALQGATLDLVKQTCSAVKKKR